MFVKSQAEAYQPEAARDSKAVKVNQPACAQEPPNTDPNQIARRSQSFAVAKNRFL